MGLTPPQELQNLQAALHAKAKASPGQHNGGRLDARWHWNRWLEQRFGLLELEGDPSSPPHANA